MSFPGWLHISSIQLLLALCMVLFTDVALSQSSANTVSVTDADYVVEHSFTTENGLPANGVNALYQDKEGYLWAATFNGLIRYDGNDFTIYNANKLPELDSNRFMSVTGDDNGNIWAGLEYSNLVMINDDTSHVYQVSEEVVGYNISINNILIDPDDGVWLGTTVGLVFFDGENFIHWDDLPQQTVQKIQMHNGEIHVLFGESLYKINRVNNELELLLEIKDRKVVTGLDIVIEDLNDPDIMRDIRFFSDSIILVTESGIVNISNENYAVLLRREQLSMNTLHGIEEKDGSYLVYGNNGVYKLSSLFGDNRTAEKYSASRVINAFIDREGSIWLATTASGLQQLVETPVYQGNRFENLMDTPMTAVFQDSRGNLWTGTNCDGLYKFTGDDYRRFGIEDGILNICVWSIAEGSDGTIWAGTWGRGVFYLPPGEDRFRPFLPEALVGVDAILSVYEDSEGVIWFGSYYNGLFRYDGRETRMVLRSDGDIVSAIRMIYEDSEGNLLFATDRGIGFFDGDKIQILSNFNVLDTRNFRVINKDTDGRFWFGSYGGGILVYEPGGNIFTITNEDGLYDDTVSQIEFDKDGNAWLAGNLGVFFIEKEELNRFFDGLDRNLRIARIGVKEGLPIRETNGGFMPSSELNESGFLFIPTVQGIAMLDTNRMELNRDLPNVQLEHIEVNGRQYAPGAISALPYDSQRIVFSFSALSFKNPEYVQFEYKMEGLDSDWRKLDNSREAVYTTLPVGEYTFRVKASNNHGFWNEQGEFLSFTVEPPFWQTWWFILIVVVSVILLITGIIHYRLKSVQRFNKELQAKVDERTKELQLSNSELKKLIDEKNKLHSILAHDLRNPFTSIIGYMDLLRQTFKDSGDKQNREMMEHLLDSGRSTLNLLENLLQWSGAAGKAFDPDLEPTNLNLLIKESIKMTDAQASFKEIDIIFDEGEPVYANADRNMILSVIRNLISNAIKFSGNKSKIYVSAEESSDNVIVCVRDEGVGIKEDELQTLFSSNGIQQKLGTGGEKGIGMGLQLCKEFVDKHEGDIWAESEYGKGTSFFFTLPKVSDEVLTPPAAV